MFNFRRLCRLLYKSFFVNNSRNTTPLTVKRGFVLFIVLSIYFFFEVLNWLGLLWDEIVYSGYRKIKIEKPIFIIGVNRSGTTFYHRLLAKDKKNFTGMQTWEILFAPSITQKKLILFFKKIDELLGQPFYRLLKIIDYRLFSGLEHIHKISLFEYEIDCLLLLHIVSTVMLIVPFPFPEELIALCRFDTDLPESERRRIMAFYKKCVQRHLYVFGKERCFLSKNPTFTPMIRSLDHTFPDARFIWMVRSPFQVLPSFMSTLRAYWHSMRTDVDDALATTLLYDAVKHWYSYPMDVFRSWPSARYIQLFYEDWRPDPEPAVRELYDRFGLTLSSHSRSIFLEETQKAITYKSGHTYSLEQYGMNREELADDFRNILPRYCM